MVAEAVATPTTETEVVSPTTENAEAQAVVTPELDAEGKPIEAKPEPTPVDLASAAAVKETLSKTAAALGIEGDFSTADELQAAIQGARETAHTEAVERDLQTAHEDTYIEIYDALSAIKFGEAEGLGLSREQIRDSVGRPMAQLLDGVRELAAVDAYETLGTGLTQILPEDEWESFETEVQGKDGKGVSVKDWISLATEKMAPHTKAWKERELEHQTALTKAKADGWTEAQGAPSGAPTQSRQVGGAGKLTGAQFLAMTPDQQATAWRERPEEVRAL